MLRFFGMAGLVAALLLTVSLGDVNAQGKGKGKFNIEAVFKKLDTNQDDRLSKAEFKVGVEKLAEKFKEKVGEEKAAKFVERRLAAFDAADAKAEGDGLNLDQFRRFMAASFKKGKQQRQNQ